MTVTGNRWWHVFFGITMLVVVVLAWTTDGIGGALRIVATATVAALIACWLAFGSRASGSPARAVAFCAVLIVGSGLLIATNPNLAIVQAISFPLVWTLLERTRDAIVANVLLTLAAFAGFVVALGPGPDAYLQATFIEGISLVGSLALGLWISRIADLSHERKRLLDELTSTQEQLAALSRDSGITSERERLAREIHDTIAQSLTGLVMVAQRSRRALAAGDLDRVAEQLALLEDGGREALAETRSLVAASAPIELSAGIGPALERLAERFSRETGIAVSAEVPVDLVLERDSQVAILRCAQEGLANVRKHSRATIAGILLTCADDGYRLTVHDDGTGFDTSLASTGFGLSGLRERLAMVDGRLEISSHPDEGTTLVAYLPQAASA